MARRIVELLFLVLHGETRKQRNERLERHHNDFMAAIDRLLLALAANSSALDANTVAVEELTREWNKPAPAEEAVDAAAAALETQTVRLADNTARINNLLTPVVPAPEPTE